jgi:hypothetical protein
VSRRALLVSALIVVVLVFLGMLVFDLPFQNAVVLAPVFVLSVGAIAFLVILWTKVAYDSIRSRASTSRSRSDSSL